ncbi:hypothetical protein P1X14_05065 [Sphingomonas sp. AOB5]|uniref:hypothetical protein n=1 Tax=Sphingomonas sp. AOB5 TaxID=3034017 RepID=UPI0023F8A479|nr:hypothetical protein [Sphingomonas sp. AOB5]MDF7774609.1 hypothetical protein [Sphingomonas sp. AOB5]
MRAIVGSVAALSLLSTTSCTAILKEVRYPGGYPAYVLDKRTFNASGSKQMILLRATLILGLAAEMSRVTVNGEDADAFAKHLKNATDEINYAAADVYSVGDRAPCSTTDDSIGPDNDCKGFYENFDANLPLIEGRLIRVMLAVLPTDQARKFLDDASKGNILGAALNAFRTVMKAAGGLHVGAARYRTGLEVVAGQMGDKCYSGRAFEAGNLTTVIEAAACIGLSQDNIFAKSPPDQRSKLAVPVLPAAFIMLMRGVAAACVALPYGGSEKAVNDSRKVREEACGAIRFNPTGRPTTMEEQEDGDPDPTATPTPTPTPPPTT